MIDITKEQIEDTLNIARMLDTRGLLDLGLIVKIKQLALCGLETQRRPIEQAPKDGRKLILFLLGGNLCFGSFSQKEQIWITSEGEHLDKLPITGFLLLSALGESK